MFPTTTQCMASPSTESVLANHLEIQFRPGFIEDSYQAEGAGNSVKEQRVPLTSVLGVCLPPITICQSNSLRCLHLAGMYTKTWQNMLHSMQRQHRALYPSHNDGPTADILAWVLGGATFHLPCQICYQHCLGLRISTLCQLVMFR